MPRQQRHPNRTTYTKVLSALLKPELVRLCGEFRLPTEGAVVILRKRLKDYLNLHRDTLYYNQRYTALFPRHRRAGGPPQSPPHSAHNASSRRSTSTLSDASSSARSFDAWDGIQDDPHHIPLEPLQPIVQPLPGPLAQGPAGPYPPPPSPSSSGSEPDFPPPTVHSGDSKYISHPLFIRAPRLFYEALCSFLFLIGHYVAFFLLFRALCSLLLSSGTMQPLLSSGTM